MESISKWSKHPVRVECGKENGECKSLEYSYKHQICWLLMLGNRHHRRSCNLPKYVEAEKEIFRLNDISSAEVKDMGKYFVVYLKNGKGYTIDIAKYKERMRAEYIKTQFNNSLSGWQNSSESLSDPYFGTYIFDFPED